VRRYTLRSITITTIIFKIIQMNFKTASLISILGLCLVACATSTANYSPPVESKVINTKIVNKQFDVVWDSLVKELSSDFFVINNIDKNSRLINISFTSQRPSDFVDCGIATRTFTNVQGEQKYSYKSADTASFVATDKQGRAFSVSRTSRLEGRTNIYVAPENDKTNITVNTKYVISVGIKVTDSTGRTASESAVYDPSTKQSYTNGSVTCVAIGTLEDRILRAAQ
jgi:hypothetical protein